MCTVSMIGDHYSDKFRSQWPQIFAPQPFTLTPPGPQVTREEFESLQREVREMVALLRRAKIYDAEHNEPDCEMDEKMAALRLVARLIGVDLDAAISQEGVR